MPEAHLFFSDFISLLMGSPFLMGWPASGRRPAEEEYSPLDETFNFFFCESYKILLQKLVLDSLNMLNAATQKSV